MRLDGIPLWDGTEYRGPVDLAWEPDRITDLSPAAQRHDDLCVLPGLVDTHVHLVGYAGAGEPPDFATWPLTTTRDEQVLHGAAHAQRAMRHGVTTLRDLAGDEAQIALRRAFDAGILAGPRIQVHGVVGMTAGHNDLFVPPAVPLPLRKPTADGPDECRKLVRTWARAGMDGIKLTTSGGVLSIGDRNVWRNYTRDEIRAVVDEAHALGMRVASHAHSEDGIRVAAEEGVDSIEHGTLMSRDLAETLAARRTPVAPTLLINEAIAEGRVPVTREAMDKAAELVATRNVLLAQAAALGVRFVLGTDANGHHVRFGDQLAEVVHMTRVLGLDADSALRAATSDAADAIGMPVGRLAPGLGADLIVLRGRPWERIEDLATENIVAVVSRGRLVAGRLP
ncbi:amidohydrolase family protein [Nonomuraea fuscirosea]|jgi:imidazolonepropionase-like amidohydrolase|uniref:amidohydrolase family protein n=1 Tax=Nonomuraea fuscirosea TaxID=1291556 RepID=UPI002DDA9132|nr:amidohydrolase family protein [Nonomuraea fuscirosea]WSA53261.1 amidohydrolase family protein [Nonomuraea fuscirosea]